jgi:hypothetical protein
MTSLLWLSTLSSFNDWKAKHVIIGLFEVIDTTGIALAPKLQELLDKFTLTKKNSYLGKG